jgi:hypothetical protein
MAEHNSNRDGMRVWEVSIGWAKEVGRVVKIRFSDGVLYADPKSGWSTVDDNPAQKPDLITD